MNSNPPNKPVFSKKAVVKKAEVKKPEPKAAPKQLELKAGLVCKCGMWMIESFRERDGMWIITPTKANKKAVGRVPMDDAQARAQMEK